MKRENRPDPEPEERFDTIRRHIVNLLCEYELSAREISRTLHVPEREVNDHLDHIRRSLHHQNRRLVVTPALCDHCGFVFSKRDRVSKPGKCPDCHRGTIRAPRFSIPTSSR